MAKKDLKQYYSCKRKPDIVTWVAIGLFLVMILFQVYLIAFLPMRLQSDEALTYNVVRDKMLLNIDKIRQTLPKLEKRKFGNEKLESLATGEIQMTRSAFERLMLHTRNHRDALDLAQVTELSQRFQMFNFMIRRWNAEKPEYYLRAETLDEKKYIRMLEQRIQEQEKISQ